MAIMETHGFIPEILMEVHGPSSPDSRERITLVDRPNHRSPKTVRRRTALTAVILGMAAFAAGLAVAEYPLV